MAWSGLEMAYTWFVYACRAVGSTTWYSTSVESWATCGSFASAA